MQCNNSLVISNASSQGQLFCLFLLDSIKHWDFNFAALTR